MCVRVNCRQCGKPTWSGCGAHQDAVLAGIPKDQRCHCREDKAAQKPAASGGFWSMFSRPNSR